MILFILYTLTFVAVVTGLLSTCYWAYRDKHGHSPRVLPDLSVFPLKSNVITRPRFIVHPINGGPMMLRGYQLHDIPPRQSPPRSISSIFTSEEVLAIQQQEHPAYDAPSITYTDLS